MAAKGRGDRGSAKIQPGPASLLALIVFATLASSFTSSGCKETPAPRPLLDALLAMAAEPAVAASLAPARPFDPAASRREVDRIANKVAATRVALPAAIHDVVFTELAFAREITDKDPRFALLPAVLAGRKGTCVGLGTLALVIGEALARPMHAVLVPGHLFVRVPQVQGGSATPAFANVELLREAEVVDDDFYRSRYPTREPPPAAYWRPLSQAEVLAVVRYNLGNEWRRRGQLDDAIDSYRKAVAGFPDLAVAHASLGLALQMAERPQEAVAAYDAAARAEPGLPGLAENRNLLERTGDANKTPKRGVHETVPTREELGRAAETPAKKRAPHPSQGDLPGRAPPL